MVHTLDSSISAPVLFSAIGAAAALLFQQAIDVWKTSATHRNELRRRFFDIKFQTAIDLAKCLDAIIASHQARLAEALEWTRDDEKFQGLESARQVLNLHKTSLEKEYEQYMAAFAVLDLVFSAKVVTAATQSEAGLDLLQAWRAFDDERTALVDDLNRLLPDARWEALREQRARDQYEEGAREEMVEWMAVYKSGIAKLRVYLPRIAEATAGAERHRQDVIRAIRDEMKPYEI